MDPEQKYFADRPLDNGNWLIHGHLHQHWKINRKQINVSVDVWNFEPLPLKPNFEISPEITQLTGWTTSELKKQGIETAEATRRLVELYGFTNRLLVSDSSHEIAFLEQSLNATFSPHRLNVSILFSLFTCKHMNLGLETMLDEFEMQFG